MNRPIRTAVFALLVAVPALPAGAQKILTAPASPPQATPAPPRPGLPAGPPYDDGLFRLSEILGSLHYLRELCGAGEAGLWRDQMQALIDSEQPDPDRRARFVDRFNRGYQSFRSVYVTCTPAATLAIDRYVEEGRRIARDIAARYGREK